MLYLVQIPGRRKRIQQNADSAEEAIAKIYNNLTEELRNGALITDCIADECEDPMDQFIMRGEDDAI